MHNCKGSELSFCPAPWMWLVMSTLPRMGKVWNERISYHMQHLKIYIYIYVCLYIIYVYILYHIHLKNMESTRIHTLVEKCVDNQIAQPYSCISHQTNELSNNWSQLADPLAHPSARSHIKHPQWLQFRYGCHKRNQHLEPLGHMGHCCPCFSWLGASK